MTSDEASERIDACAKEHWGPGAWGGVHISRSGWSAYAYETPAEADEDLEHVVGGSVQVTMPRLETVVKAMCAAMEATYEPA